MEYLNQLEKMLESGHRIIAMESYEVDRICNLLLELSRFSTKSYYMVQPDQGMYRLGTSHISIPHTQKAEDVLQHIDATQHYGIFILRDYAEILKDKELVEDLINIATGDTNKVVVLIAEHIELPKELKPFTLRSKHQMKDTG